MMPRKPSIPTIAILSGAMIITILAPMTRGGDCVR